MSAAMSAAVAEVTGAGFAGDDTVGAVSSAQDALVSVIIPAFNAQDWIARALRSVQRQDYPQVEVIVVDDGSTDGTKDACAEHRSLVRYFRQEHQGVSAARNLGIHYARGGFLVFLDSDDELLPGMISALVDVLGRMPGTGVVSGAFFIESAGERVRIPLRDAAWQPAARVQIVPRVFSAMAKGLEVCVGSVMLRRVVLRGVNGFREDLQYGEDLEFWLRIAGRTPWAYIDRETMIYHHDPRSSTTLRKKGPRIDRYMMDEGRMKRCLSREDWGDYRVLRAQKYLYAAKELACHGKTRLLRLQLSRFTVEPRCLAWLVLKALSTLPPGLCRAATGPLVAVYRLARSICAHRGFWRRVSLTGARTKRGARVGERLPANIPK